MTIEEMKRIKKEKGYSYIQIAHMSGVPLGTVQKIFGGETKSPRYDTILALESLFRGETSAVREEMTARNTAITMVPFKIIFFIPKSPGQMEPACYSFSFSSF